MASVRFEHRSDGDGLVVTDAIERRRCELHTDGATALEPVARDRFSVPVDAATAVRTATLRLPQIFTAYIRDADGDLVEEIRQFEACTLDDGRFEVELNAPIKLYLEFDGPCEVTASGVDMQFAFDEVSAVQVGARSYHERPEATLTTTTDPEDVMRVVSYLGSALKTTTCERSYPTLRGHPPAIELGDRVDVPDHLEKPDTGVTIEVPARYDAIFAVAPLAYYLAADVTPGTTPRLVTDRGFVHPLDGPGGFEREVERVLKQVFFLDCLTRTEGRYPVDLHEREELEDVLGFDFPALFEAPLAEQLETYLSVPFSVVEDHLPSWKLTAHVEPEASNVETLPFLVDDLAVIRSPKGTQVTQSEAQSEAIKAFMRSEPTRSTTQSAPNAGPSLVQPETADSLEQSWVGEHAPIGASKSSLRAFRNRLERDADDGEINITVVCNDEEMLEEHDDVRNVYGNRDNLPFDVTLYENLTTDRLRFVLESDVEFFHYIGHIEDGGFKCPDGLFDARTLDEVGIEAFFLNACSSYTQGMALIDAGAIGGVVTLDDVINSGAVRVGRTMARLLNRGFPLSSALDIAKERSIVGTQYIVLGDGGFEVTQAESVVPILYEIEAGEDHYEVRVISFATRDAGLGTMVMPSIRGRESSYLVSGDTPAFEMSSEELTEYLELEDVPVRYDGGFYWSSEFPLP